MNKTIKKIICLSLLLVMVTGCGRVPKLKDGSELIDAILKNIGINAKDGIKKHR